MTPKRACDTCYRKKIQCFITDSGTPCNWCSHRGLECTFNRETLRKSKRKRVTSAYVEELLLRIQQLERALPQTPGPPQQASPTANQAVESHEPLAFIPDPEEPRSCQQPAAAVGNGQQEDVNTAWERCSREPASSPSLPPPASLSSSTATPHSRLSSEVFPIENWMGLNWFFNGIPIFSEQGRQWISQRTGQGVELAKLLERGLSNEGPASHTSPESSLNLPFSRERCELPDKDMVGKIFAVFFRSAFQLFFPVLDRILFEETLELAYETVDAGSLLSSPKHVSARACVLSAMPVVCRLKGTRSISHVINAVECERHAKHLILCNTGDASLVTLQAILMLYVQHILSHHYSGACFYLSLACRMVTTLGGHVYRQSLDPRGGSISLNERKARHTRVLFWLCYMADKDLSLRTGHTPLLTDAYCDLTLPDGYSSWYTYLRGLDEYSTHDDHEQPFPHLFGDPQLSKLKETVYRTLYSARALCNVDDLPIHIRQLDGEIERWRASIPADFRPTLVLPPTFPMTGNPVIKTPHRMKFVYLQMEYHHLLTVIHTTMRRYSCAHSESPDEAEAQDVHTAIHSSFDLSLEASRSTLGCLRALIESFAEQAFHFIVYYAPTAVMPLFLDILIHPSGPNARLDLERLVSVANVIQGFRLQTLTEEEASRVAETSNWIMGLSWLGSCAIIKANGEGMDTY